MKTEWISIPAYAKRIGMSPQYIRRLVNNGKITETALRQKGKRFLVNPKQADADRAGNTSYINQRQPVKQSGNGNQKETVLESEKKQTAKAAGTAGLTLSQAQTIQAQYKAALMKLEYEQKSGKLVTVEDVEKDAFNIARIVRDSILNIPDRISAELASITDVHIISEKLTSELVNALEELSL